MQVIGCKIKPVSEFSVTLHLKLTYNPKGIMLDLLVEALILINPPIDAVLAGIVWKYCLPWPHLSGKNMK